MFENAWSRRVSLFSLSGFLGNCVIRIRLIIDNLLDHLADVRAQQPIDRDAHELRRIQDRTSLHDGIDSVFLIRPEPDVYDFFAIDSSLVAPL